MTNKNLIAKLNNLKTVNPEAEWLTSNRDLFLAQISNSGAEKLTAWEVFVINFRSFAKASSQPAFTLAVFFLLLVSSSIFGHKLFSQAKPNDSLYIARVISEKAKLNTVMDTKARDKMAVQFATNHAKDISAVLADPEFNTEDNQAQVAKLSENFNKEMDTVKVKMEKLAAAKPVVETPAVTPETATSSDDEVSIAAGSGIDDKGIQISATPAVPAIPGKEIATTTPAVPAVPATPAISTEPVIAPNVPDQVKEMFEKKEYNNVIDKLNEVEELINKN